MRGTNPYPYSNSNPYAPASSYDSGQTGNADGLVNKVMETIQQNPIPAALAGLGVGYLVMQGQGSKSQGHSNNYPSYGNQSNGQAGIGQKVGDVASQAGDTVGNIAQKAGDTVGSVTQKAGDLVGQAGSKVGDIAGGVAGGVGDTLGAVAGGVGNTVGAVAGGVGDIAGNVVGGVGDTVGGVVEGVQYQTLRAEITFGRLLQETPLALGAVALALGITVGMMLPGTPQENQIMGAAHDTFMGKVQETTQQTFEKVQHVTEEVSNTTKNAVADISNTASQQAHEQGLIK